MEDVDVSVPFALLEPKLCCVLSCSCSNKFFDDFDDEVLMMLGFVFILLELNIEALSSNRFTCLTPDFDDLLFKKRLLVE